MILKPKTLVLSAGLAVAACTHPADVSHPLTEVADKNAHFTVKDIPGGFSVEVRYSRYQFVPDPPARSVGRGRARPRRNRTHHRRAPF